MKVTKLGNYKLFNALGAFLEMGFHFSALRHRSIGLLRVFTDCSDETDRCRNRKILLGPVFILSVLLTACSAGTVGTVQEEEQNLIVSNSAMLANRLQIASMKYRRIGDLLQANVELRNRWKFKLDFKYQFKWFDKDGFEIAADGRPWQLIVINGNNVRSVQATAPNPSAHGFKIYVQD